MPIKAKKIDLGVAFRLMPIWGFEKVNQLLFSEVYTMPYLSGIGRRGSAMPKNNFLISPCYILFSTGLLLFV